jgi:hypothetical protein
LVQVCADILGGGGWTGLKLPDTGRGKPRVNITVPYPVLLGHRAPCDLVGHGPICTEQALPLIGAGELYRMLVDPASGQLLDYGRTRYRPPPHLAEFVRARDGQCPIPSCHQSADRADVDHIVPAKPDPVTGLPTLGTTSADNLAPPCPHHHLSKDAGRGFHLHRATDGTYTWTTPLGRVYSWRPDPLWHTDTDHPWAHDPDPDGGIPDGGIPACGCPDSCSCQQPLGTGPGTGTDRTMPVTTHDDWADEFPTPEPDPPDDPDDAGSVAGIASLATVPAALDWDAQTRDVGPPPF